MLIVDSTVWVDYFNGIENPQTDYLHQIADKTPILIGDFNPGRGPAGISGRCRF